MSRTGFEVTELRDYRRRMQVAVRAGIVTAE